MPLSEELRNELAGITPERDCDRLAELSGLAHTAGSLHIHGRGEIGLHLDLASPAAARRAFSLLRELGVTSEIRTYQRRAFGRETRYQLHVEGANRAALTVLQEAGIVGARRAPLERPPQRVVARACCRAAYLRGSLLGGGTLSGPKSPHLEVRTATVEGAEFIAEIAARAGVELRVLDKGRHAVAYAKGTGADCGRARRGGGERRGARARGAGRDGRDEGACEPARERGSRESRAHEPGGPGADPRSAQAPARRGARLPASEAAGGRSAAASLPVAFAARAGAPMQPAGDEIRGTTAPFEPRQARRVVEP